MTRTERQKLSIKKWKEAGCRSSIVAATGTGKTRIALMTIGLLLPKNPQIKVRIIVPTKVLKDQWETNISEFQLEGDIKVFVLNSAAKKPFSCDFLIVDELHRSNSLTFRELFNQCHPAMIMGLTATYERLDGFEKEVVDHYCPVCDTITIEEATHNGWLSPYREYKVMLDVDLREYNNYNREFLQHFAFFDFNFNDAMAAATNVFKQQQITRHTGCELKEVKIHAYGFIRALKARKAFIANHPKKIEIAKKIIEARKDKKIITFNTSIDQCHAYGEGYIVSSKQTKKKNQAVLEEFARCNSGVIHSSKMLIEGLDCPGLSVAIIAGFTSSKTARIQEVGRCIRKEEGKQAEIFTLVIRGTVEEQWYRKATEDMSYIEINEDELEQVLSAGEVDKKEQKQDKVFNDLLRI